MKFNELKQAMDWRRRVGFNGGGYVKKEFYQKRNLKKKLRKEN